jgi:hypothetical protein
MTEIDVQTSSHARPAERRTDWDYLVAAAYTLALITPCPFFWNPPFWVLALLSGPASGRGHRLGRAGRAAPVEVGWWP